MLPKTNRSPEFAGELSTVRLPDWLTAQPQQDQTITQAILVLDQMARDRNVTLYPQHDFALLRRFVDANRHNRANLSSMHDPRYCHLDPENSFWLAGVDDSGRIVTTNSGKLFDLHLTNLERHARGLKLFFDDPSNAAAGDVCAINCAAAKQISGSVFHSGTVWRHPEHSGELSDGIRISQLTGRITRLVGMALWDSDYYLSFTRTALIERGMAATLGYSRYEPGIKLKLMGGEAMDVCLIWMDRAELAADAGLIAREGKITRPGRAKAAA